MRKPINGSNIKRWHLAPGTFEGNFEFEIPKNLQETDLEVNVGSGSYKPIGYWSSGKGNIDLQYDLRSKTMFARKGKRMVEVPNPAWPITIKLPNDLADREWRVIGFDPRRKRINLVTQNAISELGPPVKFLHLSYEGSRGSLAKLVLESRNRERRVVYHLPLLPKAGK